MFPSPAWGDEVGLAEAWRAGEAARAAGLPDPLVRLFVAITMAESKGDPDAVGDVELEDEKWGPSVGLNQIRTLRAQRGTGGPRDIERLFDPVENMRAAASLLAGERFSSGGETWYEPGGEGQWSTVPGGEYLDFLPLAEQVVELMDRFH